MATVLRSSGLLGLCYLLTWLSGILSVAEPLHIKLRRQSTYFCGQPANLCLKFNDPGRQLVYLPLVQSLLLP